MKVTWWQRAVGTVPEQTSESHWLVSALDFFFSCEVPLFLHLQIEEWGEMSHLDLGAL